MRRMVRSMTPKLTSERMRAARILVNCHRHFRANLEGDESKGKGSKHDNLGHGRFPSPLCAAAAVAEPEMLADELFLLLEGVRVTAQSVGPKGLGDRLVRMGEAMIKAHTKIGTARSIN